MTMNTRGLTRQPVSILMIACAILTLLLAACQPANAATLSPTTATSLPTQAPTTAPTPAPTAAPTQAPTPATTGELVLNFSGVATDAKLETVGAMAPSTELPWWAAMPKFQRATLLGYPVSGHSLQPQINIYSVADLKSFNKYAAQEATNLQALPQSIKPGASLPYLPLINAKQALDARVQMLDFKNGSGVRYLTQYNQGPVMINNNQLVYTFQGLTRDGKYYVAATLPVTHPALPATQKVYEQPAGYPAYAAQTAAWLNQQPAASFTPDLGKLDAMIEAIVIN